MLVLLAVTLWRDWRVGLTAAALVAIADTIYQSKTMSLIPAAARAHSAQRRTGGGSSLPGRPATWRCTPAPFPAPTRSSTTWSIGPGGVYAVDSERWDRRLPVRTVASDSAAGPVLYHGPFSQKSRLAHARWAAAQAATLLSAELGREVEVKPAMVIYGPTVPWAVTNLRGVDVFSGRKVIRYFRSRKRVAGIPPLSWEQAGEVYYAAQRALPPG